MIHNLWYLSGRNSWSKYEVLNDAQTRAHNPVRTCRRETGNPSRLAIPAHVTEGHITRMRLDTANAQASTHARPHARTYVYAHTHELTHATNMASNLATRTSPKSLLRGVCTKNLYFWSIPGAKTTRVPNF